jgi:hypothetical protein
MGGGGIDPRILKLGTRWRCGQLHDPAALSPWKLYTRLGEPQNRFGHGGEVKKDAIIASAGNRTPSAQPVAYSRT